jgi:hypothetical protein
MKKTEKHFKLLVKSYLLNLHVDQGYINRRNKFNVAVFFPHLFVSYVGIMMLLKGRTQAGGGWGKVSIKLHTSK